MATSRSLQEHQLDDTRLTAAAQSLLLKLVDEAIAAGGPLRLGGSDVRDGVYFDVHVPEQGTQTAVNIQIPLDGSAELQPLVEELNSIVHG